MVDDYYARPQQPTWAMPYPTDEQARAMMQYLAMRGNEQPAPPMLPGSQPAGPIKPPGPSLDALLEADARAKGQGGGLYNTPVGPGTALPSPFSGGGAQPPGGAAQSFMGMTPAPPKDQSRMPMYGGPQPGVKGDPWASPSAPQGAQGGGGVASGGAAPQQPQGPVTIQSVMISLAQANPELMKTREGRITLGMAAMKFGPLMMKEDQMELQRMKLEMNNQLAMIKMQQGEARLGLQEERLKAYEQRLEAGGSADVKELNSAIKERDTVANHLANQPNSKELKSAYQDAQKRVEELNKKVNPQPKAKEYETWLGAAIGKPDADIIIASSIPADIKDKLSAQEMQELIKMLKDEPVNAHMRIMKLREKLRGGETTVGKSDGYY